MSAAPRPLVSHSVLLVAALQVATLALGVAKEMAIAAWFGISAETDAYLMAFLVIGTLYRPFAGGVLGAAAVPVLTERSAAGHGEEAQAIAGGLAGILAAALVPAAAAGIVAAPWIIAAVAPGFQPPVAALTARLLRWMSPMLVCIALAAVAEAVLHAHRRFGPPATALALFNATMCGGVLALGIPWGITGVAVGTLLASAALLAWQAGALRRAGIPLRPRLAPVPPGTRRVLRLAGPLFVTYTISQFGLVVERLLATTLGLGSVSALSYAFKVSSTVPRIIAAPIATVFFPSLSTAAAQRDPAAFADTLSRGLRVTAFLALPATVLLVLLRAPLTRLLFQRGAFGSQATDLTAPALGAYVLGLLPACLLLVSSTAFYARQDIRSPLLVGLVTLGANVALDLLLIRGLRHTGLALGAAGASACGAAVAVALLWRQGRAIAGWPLVRAGARMAWAVAAMGVTLWAARGLLAAQRGLWELARLGALGILACLVYLGVALWSRSEEAAIVWWVLRDRCARLIPRPRRGGGQSAAGGA
jgi:putative peptidoglycan lipid II flippase